jgi:hypothetical protein
MKVESLLDFKLYHKTIHIKRPFGIELKQRLIKNIAHLRKRVPNSYKNLFGKIEHTHTHIYTYIKRAFNKCYWKNCSIRKRSELGYVTNIIYFKIYI